MRDIDDWMFHFERQVASQLKKLFSDNVEELPLDLAVRLEKLRAADGLRQRQDDGDKSPKSKP